MNIEAAAERRQPCAHPGKAGPLSELAAGSVVVHGEPHFLGCPLEAHVALGRARVADDVGYGFAKAQRERTLFVRTEGDRIDAVLKLDPRGVERFAGASDLVRGDEDSRPTI